MPERGDHSLHGGRVSLSSAQREENVRGYARRNAAAGTVDEQTLLIDSVTLGAKEWAKVHRPGAVHKGHAGEVPALSGWLSWQSRVSPHAASNTTVAVEQADKAPAEAVGRNLAAVEAKQLLDVHGEVAHRAETVIIPQLGARRRRRNQAAPGAGPPARVASGPSELSRRELDDR